MLFFVYDAGDWIFGSWLAFIVCFALIDSDDTVCYGLGKVTSRVAMLQS